MRGVTDSARSSARLVAQHLGILHHEFDVTKEFDDIIVKDFVNEYKNGRTPNPCIHCNEQIKLGVFLERARELSCDKVATGHYAGVTQEGNLFLLKRGVDKNEQSYFLYRLQQHHLERMLMPLGSMKRVEVEAYAKKNDLPSASYDKSQDICFVPDNDCPSFLAQYIDSKPGSIVDTKGKILGKHKGICAYTIGQRRGLGVSAPYPLYVLRIEPETNTIVVGKEQDIYSQELLATDVRLIALDTVTTKLAVHAKPRYVSPLQPATIEPSSNRKIKLVFEQPQWALTPGQSVVFYQNDTLVGGGVIERIP